MAKKKSAPPKKKTVSRSKALEQRVLSYDQIGEVAGDVWRLLADKDGQSMAAIKTSVDAPADVVIAGVGWLAREGKLKFSKSGRSVKVSLR